MTTSEFVKQFRQADPRKLALQASRYPDVDMPYALNQIQGWQTALRKLPSWAACDGVVYPPHLNMEQCSSEATARYKQQVVRRWAERIPNASRTSMTDLTGGFGVDFSFTSRCFDCATYVERNASLCEVVGANLPRLGIRNAQMKCAEAEAVLEQLEPQTMIFLDPARRDEHGAKTVLIADCTPDVCQLLPSLMQKSQFVMLKLSPMLDWHKAVEDLQGAVREVHIVSVGGECKELLLVLSEEIESELKVFCADLEAGGGSGEAGLSGGSSSSSCSGLSSEPSFPRTPSSPSASSHASLFVYTPSSSCPAPNSKLKTQNSKFLHEPNASIMKAGCFDELAAAYGVSPVSRNSHLFLSAEPVDGFPGRSFSIERVTTLNKRELRQALAGIEKANIATRNFPLSVAELRKRLKLKDGGDVYIFATTTAEDEHLLLISHKYQ